MSHRLKLVAFGATLAAVALGFAATADAQSTSSNNGVPASLQRENHLSHDKWARGEPTSSSAKHDDDGDRADSDNHSARSGPHKGELNGKLHMGDWS